MKTLSFLIIFILSTSIVFSKEKKCQNMQDLYEKAEKETYDNMPIELADTSLEVDFLNTEICEGDDNEIVIITSDANASARHLVATGLYFGYGVLGAEGHYLRLHENGGYKDHFRLMGLYFPDLWAGVGIQYSKHIKGSKFYVGGNAHFLRVFDTVNNYAVAGVMGVAGGKGRVSGFLEVGVRTAFEGNLVETMPHVGFGIRFRIFRR